MNCPNCGDRFSLIDLIRYWLLMNMPNWLFFKINKYNDNADLNKLKAFYTPQANLTTREHIVCRNRVGNVSKEEIARLMNVTVERVRQIEAKALRKLTRCS